ncbi:hypothetical protein SKAU_G00261620 [Synaphobranchus kaupii]|uniref:Uncharacterized protein n=1 Tax=Synaphobranchus kaupii TaxID=118154 RepID=A0A9Q1EYJ5_SYNKA|nr:hypothetical protein SKAU_G00261620 [Synaphobranchus kaupii]
MMKNEVESGQETFIKTALTKWHRLKTKIIHLVNHDNDLGQMCLPATGLQTFGGPHHLPPANRRLRKPGMLMTEANSAEYNLKSRSS